MAVGKFTKSSTTPFICFTWPSTRLWKCTETMLLLFSFLTSSLFFYIHNLLGFGNLIKKFSRKGKPGDKIELCRTLVEKLHHWDFSRFFRTDIELRQPAITILLTFSEKKGFKIIIYSFGLRLYFLWKDHWEKYWKSNNGISWSRVKLIFQSWMISHRVLELS